MRNGNRRTFETNPPPSAPYYACRAARGASMMRGGPHATSPTSRYRVDGILQMGTVNFSWMIGRSIANISFSEPATWFFSFGNSSGIRVECPWRLLAQGLIRVSSDDHEQQFGLPAPIDAAAAATSMLSGLVVLKVSVLEGTADFFIDFERNQRLEIIPISSGYESWQVSDPTGKTIFAQGGGRIVEF